MRRTHPGNMRDVRREVLIAIVAALLVAAPAQACPTGAAGAYDTGGSPRAGSPNDPLSERQWGLEQIRAPQAWAAGARGAGITIAVVDTGVDLRHPDLAAKLVPGIDLVTGDGCAEDEEGHGTHVAGIAAAATDNGIGVAGVAPDATLMPVRVLDADGAGTDPVIANGIRQAADRGARVINLSIGGDPGFAQAPQLNEEVEAAVEYAWTRGAVIVAAAGNETFPLCSYPAASRHAICVAANDPRGAPALYSNLPADPDGTMAVRAPGGTGTVFCEDDEDVWSTIWPRSEADQVCEPGGIEGYDTLAGTSMATPHVAGVAALLLGRGLSNGQVVECLRTTSSNRGSYDPVRGYGTVDAEAAVKTCSPGATPSGPTGGDTSGTAPTTAAPGDRTKPAIRLRMRRTTLRTLLRRKRLPLVVSASEASRVRIRVRHGRVTLGRRSLGFDRAGSRRATVRLTRTGLRRLRRTRRPIRLVLSWRAVDRAGNVGRGRAVVPLRRR